jgi:hypothetical protein
MAPSLGRHPNHGWCWVQIIKFFIMQCFPASCYIMLGPNILLILFSNTLSLLKAVTSGFGDKPRWFLKGFQVFGKYCCSNFQGECLWGLGSLYKDLSGSRVEGDWRDWASREAGCYPMGSYHVIQKKNDERSFSGYVVWKRSDKKIFQRPCG